MGRFYCMHMTPIDEDCEECPPTVDIWDAARAWQAFCDWCGSDALRALEAKAKGFKWLVDQHKHDADELRADRDRLAGEVEKDKRIMSASAKFIDELGKEVTRLTSELAAAGEEIDGHENYLRSIARTHLDLAPSIEHFIGRDAARRAGGEA